MESFACFCEDARIDRDGDETKTSNLGDETNEDEQNGVGGSSQHGGFAGNELRQVSRHPLRGVSDAIEEPDRAPLPSPGRAKEVAVLIPISFDDIRCPAGTAAQDNHL